MCSISTPKDVKTRNKKKKKDEDFLKQEYERILWSNNRNLLCVSVDSLQKWTEEKPTKIAVEKVLIIHDNAGLLNQSVHCQKNTQYLYKLYFELVSHSPYSWTSNSLFFVFKLQNLTRLDKYYYTIGLKKGNLARLSVWILMDYVNK